LKEDEMERYWSFVALEAQDLGAKLRSDKWKKAARNRLADYADRRARDFVVEVVKEVIKLDRSARVLDVGCGPGKWSIMFAKTCSSVTAQT
jgi:2-polyprenyl-3-methyl-5-hydroxy-6-metoxy-1,4-benzoquinol methylase